MTTPPLSERNLYPQTLRHSNLVPGHTWGPAALSLPTRKCDESHLADSGVDECRVSVPRGHVSGRSGVTPASCDFSSDERWRFAASIDLEDNFLCGHVVCIQLVAAGFTKCQVNVDAHTTYLRVHDLSAAIEGRGHERWARGRPAVIAVCVMDGRYTYILCGHVTVFGIDSGPQRSEKFGHGGYVVPVSVIPGFPQIPLVDRSLPTGYKHSTAHARAPRGDTSRGYAREETVDPLKVVPKTPWFCGWEGGVEGKGGEC
ncbi:hypothetical protein C0Q70_02358 [Pomacea canaliculata]|uniref:Uncharacterized protein n=1 Tax=Pomacea canaliculata TaxID=400727 RepID=A0A2T7PPP1_POMCA|nr:hypothetical protein C0Q70_02358 [Pomacea canaliculata]